MDEPALPVVLKILAVFFLVGANGFFVAAEFALVTIKRQRLKTLAQAGQRSAQAALRLTEAPSIFISVTQFGVTISSLGLGYIGEGTFAKLFERGFNMLGIDHIAASISAHMLALVFAFLIITFMHIVIGEIVPKTAALERSESVALWSARIVELIYRIFRPLIWLLNNSGQLLIRLLGMKSTLEHAMAYTGEEIRQLVSASHKEGHLIAEEQEMIHNIFDFTDTVVREVMVPRPEIIAVEATASGSELTRTLETSGCSRLPVYKEHMDNMIGIIHTKDVLPYLLRGEPIELAKLLRKPLFVPDSAQLVEVLHQMRRAQSQLAIVVDEHGGVQGIVTMEDLLEQIVGEIRDEHDTDEQRLYYREPDGSVIIDGALSIREANRKLSLNLPESDDYTTIAGFLMTKAGKLLSQGDIIEHQDIIFTIDKVERRRVSSVRLLHTAGVQTPTVARPSD
ncbi:MAG: hemolysin family protein [Acidobacteriota bacterium]